MTSTDAPTPAESPTPMFPAVRFHLSATSLAMTSILPPACSVVLWSTNAVVLCEPTLLLTTTRMAPFTAASSVDAAPETASSKSSSRAVAFRVTSPEALTSASWPMYA